MEKLKYRCSKCKTYHLISSKIGKAHQKYNLYKDSRIPFPYI